MEIIGSNKCKNCKWLKIGRHSADFSRGEGTCTQPYRNYGCNVTKRVFSNIACKYFEERKEG